MRLPLLERDGRFLGLSSGRASLGLGKVNLLRFWWKNIKPKGLVPLGIFRMCFGVRDKLLIHPGSSFL